MANRVIVKLVKRYLNLNPGEICGLDPDVASQLIKQDAAVRYEAPPSPKARPKAGEKG